MITQHKLYHLQISKWLQRLRAKSSNNIGEEREEVTMEKHEDIVEERSKEPSMTPTSCTSWIPIKT
jgi:hypothetical protein